MTTTAGSCRARCVRLNPRARAAGLFAAHAGSIPGRVCLRQRHNRSSAISFRHQVLKVASSEQIKALIKSHISRDDGHFFAVAMQVAAHEAKLGHGKLAEELRDMIDAAKTRVGQDASGKLVAIGSAAKPRGELASLLTVTHPANRLGDMVLDEVAASQLHRIIKEQRLLARIKEHGLSPRRKLLLVGPPGTGKTMTASVLAGELGIPLFLVRLDSLITKFMGETAVKLRQVFDAVADLRGVYFFDEFDAIGSQRGMGNDVGEIRRVLNSFLQMIEQDRSNSLIIAATNHPGSAGPRPVPTVRRCRGVPFADARPGPRVDPIKARLVCPEAVQA